jgi:hypothetical protein
MNGSIYITSSLLETLVSIFISLSGWMMELVELDITHSLDREKFS